MIYFTHAINAVISLFHINVEVDGSGTVRFCLVNTVNNYTDVGELLLNEERLTIIYMVRYFLNNNSAVCKVQIHVRVLYRKICCQVLPNITKYIITSIHHHAEL